MTELVWNPQPAFHPYFYTTAAEIIKHRTVFRLEITNYVAEGGRGSGKTYQFSDAVIVEGSLRKIRCLVTREFQGAISDSIKAELEKAIYARGLEKFYDIQRDRIIGLNGTLFMFKGLKNNINNIKSISDVDIVLCEEAENVTKNSWDKLLPSIRPESGRPIVIVIFNPEDELDDSYQRWVLNPPPRTVTKNINWSDNIHFPTFLNDQRLHCLQTRPKAEYEHTWEGKPIGPGGDVIIMREWVRAARFASKLPGWIKHGEKSVSYDPAGQGRDFNCAVHQDGNQIDDIDEWLVSTDLRIATRRAYGMAREHGATLFQYDECGGFGDGITVFVDDIAKGQDRDSDGDMIEPVPGLVVRPFNAGSGVVDEDDDVYERHDGKLTERADGDDLRNTWGALYTNAKAQAHAITAQKLYNTFRFVELGERGIDPGAMLSIDIDDDEMFNKLTIELSTPLWVKSEANSKRKVESKDAMKKRTELPSPNIADAIHMNNAKYERGAFYASDLFF